MKQHIYHELAKVSTRASLWAVTVSHIRIFLQNWIIWPHCQGGQCAAKWVRLEDCMPFMLNYQADQIFG